MRTLTTSTCLLLALAATVRAQDADNPRAASSAASAQRARAPLATPDDLEPAVDVGGKRVAMVNPPGVNAAPASAAPAAPPSGAAAATLAPAPASASAAPKSGSPAPQSVAPSAAANAAQAGRAPSSRALDTLDLGTTSITGNQELPKVLYIVPWKKSDLGDLVGRPVNTLLDEVLEPVDPEVFERHLNYYEGLYGKGRKEKE